MTNEYGDLIIAEGVTVKSDHQKCFNEAIASGALTTDRTAYNYAGSFMYMHSAVGVHYFKHVSTRQYGYSKETLINAAKA